MAGRGASRKFDRPAALSARPKKLPFLRREATEDGKVHVTVLLRRSRWAQWLGGSAEFERTFALDAMGQEVYDACDGHKTVATIAREFATRHKVSLAEAEASVTLFLKTLTGKGLVAMLVDAEWS